MEKIWNTMNNKIFIIIIVIFVLTNQQYANAQNNKSENPSVLNNKTRTSSKIHKDLNKPNRTQYSPLPISYVYTRFLKSNTGIEINSGQFGLNTPGSTYILGAFSFKEDETSTETMDFRTFQNSLYFFSPLIKKTFGAVANYSSSGSSSSTGYRAGFYFQFGFRSSELLMVFSPTILFDKSSPSIGRALLLSTISYRKSAIIFDPFVYHSWKENSGTTIFEPSISFRVYENLRTYMSYNQTQVTNFDISTSFNYGLEIRSSF